MSFNLGNTTIGELYVGSNKIAQAYLGSTLVYQAGSQPPQVPANHVRCKFKPGFVPVKWGYIIYIADGGTLVDADENIWDVYKRNNQWGGVFSDCGDLLEVIGMNTTNVNQDMNNMFSHCTALSSVGIFDTSNITNMYGMFTDCSSLNTIPSFNTSNVTSMHAMFARCTSLSSIPTLDTSNVTDMDYMFYNCTGLKNVPLFDTSKVTSMDSTFEGCWYVESGALALYQQASTQTTPPTRHSWTFHECGAATQTGAAELAQIPSDWK